MNDTESRFGTTSNAIPLLDAYIYIYSVTQTKLTKSQTAGVWDENWFNI